MFDICITSVLTHMISFIIGAIIEWKLKWVQRLDEFVREMIK